jgi:hypothetical protein
MQQPPYPPPEGPPGYGQYPPTPHAQSWAPPPAQFAPPKRGPNVGLIIGIGCGALVLLGLIVGGVVLAITMTSTKPVTRTVASAAPVAPNGSPQAELRDVRTWRGEDGSRHVIGEIVNVGTEPILAPVAKLTFFDATNKPIDSGQCTTPLESLARGEKTPCAMIVTKSETYASYKAEITSAPLAQPHKMAELRVTDVKYTGKKAGAPASLDGKITNASTFRAKGVEAIVSLYGGDGKIVAAEKAALGDLEPGSGATFSVRIADFAAPAETYRVKAVGYDRD